MIAAQKIRSNLVAYCFTVILVVILLGRYGSDAVKWILTKLYEFFIQRTPIGL